MGAAAPSRKQQGYRDLIAWQKAMELARLIYRVTEAFPKDEVFGLPAQLRRAAVSIPSNIAEGHARYSKKDFIHFLRHSRGSLAETETQITLAGDFRYCSSENTKKVLDSSDEVGRILAGLIASLED